MKMTRKQFIQTLITGSLAVVAGKTTGCSKTQSPAKAENPYAYSIDSFKHVDPKRITHRETTSIPLEREPRCIAITQEDTLLVGSEKKVYCFNSDHTPKNTFSLKTTPHALSAQTNDAIFVAFQDHIKVFNANGKVLSTWNSLGEKAFITSIAVKDKQVLAADYGNKQVWLFDLQGRLQRFIGVKSGHRHPDGFKIPSPYFDACFASDHSIWVTNPGMHRLENFSSDGQLQSYWGKPGMTLEGFSGCCNPTHFALLPNGEFVTVEKGLVRLKLYRATGVLKSVVAPPDVFQEGLTGVDLSTDSQGNIYAVDRFHQSIRIFVKK